MGAEGDISWGFSRFCLDLNHCRSLSIRLTSEIDTSNILLAMRVTRSNRSSLEESRIFNVLNACHRSVSFSGISGFIIELTTWLALLIITIDQKY